jgi:hypothetical protein
MKIDEVEHFLKSGRTIEEFMEKIDWREFEKIVREIFSVNGFNSFSNFRFRTRRRFEIDVVAAKNNLIFVADCKEWGKGRYKNGGLRIAAQEQSARAREFEKFLRSNPIARHKFKVSSAASIIPVVVTWYEETISENGNCFIVPVCKLNSFLIGSDFY